MSSANLQPQHFGPCSDVVEKIIGPSMLLFWCDGCEEFKTLPAWSQDCPDCRAELQACECEYRHYLNGTCSEPATHTTTIVCAGEAPGRYSYEVEQPRCGRH